MKREFTVTCTKEGQKPHIEKFRTRDEANVFKAFAEKKGYKTVVKTNF